MVAGTWAVLVAAGRGERLFPLTGAVPKPLLPVLGRPLAPHVLSRMAAEGIENGAGLRRLDLVLESLEHQTLAPSRYEVVVVDDYLGDEEYVWQPRDHSGIVIGWLGEPEDAIDADELGITAMLRPIAAEVARQGVTVNAVSPGYIATEIFGEIDPAGLEAALGLVPMRRYGKPSEIAAAMAFLASDDAAYITGQVLRVNGGMSMGG